MARKPREVAPGQPHHLIQRGHNRGTVFTHDNERVMYLQWLGEALATQGVPLHAYVLMDNHVHLLLSPPSGDALARAMQSVGRRYVAWFNHRHERTGTLWEGRFKLNRVDTDAYLLMCQRYIELNPVRAGIVADPGAYRWSSARHHLGQRQDPLITDHPGFWLLGNTPFDRQGRYATWLAEGTPADEARSIVEAARTGQPLAGPVIAPRRGRPRKKIDSDPII